MNSTSHITVRRVGLAVCTAAAAAFSACNDSTGPSQRSAPSHASDDRGGSNGQSGQNKSGNQDAQRTRVTIALTAPATGAPFRGADGKAQLDNRPTETQLEIEVDHVPVGTTVNFFVGTLQIGKAIVGITGEAEVELSTERGDVIPATSTGVVVSARTETGRLIVSGSF